MVPMVTDFAGYFLNMVIPCETFIYNDTKEFKSLYFFNRFAIDKKIKVYMRNILLPTDLAKRRRLWQAWDFNIRHQVIPRQPISSDVRKSADYTTHQAF